MSIDYHHNARERIKVALKDPSPSNALVTAQIATAEATLALAEQVRIGNLIALAESGRTTVNGARAALAGLYDGTVDDGAAHMTLRADIKEALGL